ncbi:MAG: aminomethyl-transferring glycine dehydrogenase subunit GcvPB [Anaerolineales bacterium]|nr:aminomethyl-transferring glycine dehydrogenase subunit GcvPB [Anaerolineales bacterium]
MTEPTIYELSSPGRAGVSLPALDVDPSTFPPALIRTELPLPQLAESDVVRHFLRLSQWNYSVDKGFYPLGSCTMKYNPKINEDTARLPGFAFVHPLQDPETAQGCLALMYQLQGWLCEISGLAAVSLQPAAGAHGELTGVLMIRAYHHDRGQENRRRMLIPNSAHGTNPASVAMAGMEAVEVPADPEGNIDLAALRTLCDETVAGLMLTNPNTLGLFEENILAVAEAVHGCGGLLYGDGANLNALLGIVRPGDLGFDVMHFNLHKTFSTPHGGGGPGSGPVGAAAQLADFLPAPLVAMIDPGNEADPPLYGYRNPGKSIGRMRAFNGNFGILVRAATYIRMLGADGLRQVAETAVLNANYLRALLKDTYTISHERTCMHEFVAEGRWADAPGVGAGDIAKRLIDYGVHPPTVKFPLIIPDALMIEPTETESKQTLDSFADTMKKIAEEAHTHPELLHDAPHNTPVGRLDEVRAAKQPILTGKLT